MSRGGEAVPNPQSADLGPASHMPQSELAGEQRDTERAVMLWHKASGLGGPPAITTLDLSRITGDWGYRFLISSDQVVMDAVFLLYGRQFARVLGLSTKPSGYTPMLQQLPGRYRPLFTEAAAGRWFKERPPGSAARTSTTERSNSTGPSSCPSNRARIRPG